MRTWVPLLLMVLPFLCKDLLPVYMWGVWKERKHGARWENACPVHVRTLYAWVHALLSMLVFGRWWCSKLTPSFLMICCAQSPIPLYGGGCPGSDSMVWMRTLIVSSGWPTSTCSNRSEGVGWYCLGVEKDRTASSSSAGSVKMSCVHVTPMYERPCMHTITHRCRWPDSLLTHDPTMRCYSKKLSKPIYSPFATAGVALLTNSQKRHKTIDWRAADNTHQADAAHTAAEKGLKHPWLLGWCLIRHGSNCYKSEIKASQHQKVHLEKKITTVTVGLERLKKK